MTYVDEHLAELISRYADEDQTFPSAWRERAVRNVVQQRYLAECELREAHKRQIETAKDCPGFLWIGQPVTRCDGCGVPVWDHDFDIEPDDGGPFGKWWRQKVWPEPAIANWLKNKRITPERAEHLRNVRPSEDPVTLR